MVRQVKPQRSSEGQEIGTFTVRIGFGSPDRRTFREVDALVDTGASFTWLPGSILSELGHQPALRRPFELGDGGEIERDIAEVPVRIEDQVLTTLCVFAPEGSKPALGALTLEQFLLMPDPHHKKLLPIRGWRR